MNTEDYCSLPNTREAEPAAGTVNMNRRYSQAANMLDCSMYHVVAVKSDGTVIAAGKNDNGQCDVSGWHNITGVSCDESGTAGVTEAGSVYYTGSNFHNQNSCTYWSNIVKVAVSNEIVYGLRTDGTVVATTEKTGYQYSSEVSDVTSWRDIVDICAGEGVIAGIRKDGTVTAIERNYYGKCGEEFYLNGMEDVSDLAIGYLGCGVLLRRDGKCCVRGPGASRVLSPVKINQHRGIVKVFMMNSEPAVILEDGTLVTEIRPGDSNNIILQKYLEDNGIEKIAAIKGSSSLTAILTEDGRVFAFSNSAWQTLSIQNTQCFGKDFRLFRDFHQLMDQRDGVLFAAELQKREKQKIQKKMEQVQAEYRDRGVCQYCGSDFQKTFAGLKCPKCGHKKDY